MLGRKTRGDANTVNRATANSTRIPKKIVSASCRRYPACTRRTRREPSSFVECGALSPTRFRNASIETYRGVASVSVTRTAISSSIRRSIPAAGFGSTARAMAAIRREPNTNASSGRSMDTLYLDLDDVLDPQEPQGLHHKRPDQHHLSHAFAKQQVHVLGVDERQGDAQECGKRQQHVAGEAAVRRVDAHLSQNL